jgi:hypothetical protein
MEYELGLEPVAPQRGRPSSCGPMSTLAGVNRQVAHSSTSHALHTDARGNDLAGSSSNHHQQNHELHVEYKPPIVPALTCTAEHDGRSASHAAPAVHGQRNVCAENSHAACAKTVKAMARACAHEAGTVAACTIIK